MAGGWGDVGRVIDAADGKLPGPIAPRHDLSHSSGDRSAFNLTGCRI
jgi:hypothetical protein